MTKHEMKKKQPKPLQELTLLDRFLFDTAMNDPKICQLILSIILQDKKINDIRISIMEKTQETYYNSRAVRLDTLAFDEKDTVYDAEAQKTNKGKRVISRRSRFYQAHIDVSLLEPGDIDFGKLNDTYVIFLCPFDIFGQEKYVYTFRMVCKEVPNLVLDDGATRIFLNTHGKNGDEVSDELVEFLHYAENSLVNVESIRNPRVKQLAEYVEQLKLNQEVGVKYMRLWEDFILERQEGREEGRQEGREEGRQEGHEEGRIVEKINLIRENFQDGCDMQTMIRFLKEKEENITLVCDIVKQYPGITDVEIWQKIHEKWK